MTDLPTGYRWATGDETENWTARPDLFPFAIVVELTMDANGYRYTNGEADVAVPLLPIGSVEQEYDHYDYDPAYDDHGVVSPYDDRWDDGYLPGSGENMYDDSYIDYLNNY